MEQTNTTGGASPSPPAIAAPAVAPAPPLPDSPPVVAAARSQIGVTVRYDSAYTALTYPGGDVPRDRGVCTDVIIRALRDAAGVDLQRQVHEDMRANFRAYPNLWGLRGPDRNIDHRRVPNLRRFFERQGWSLPVTRAAADYQPGDLVTCAVPPNLPHIMLVSDRRAEDGAPLVIHNIGAGAREEPQLFAFPLTGHYRGPW
ncbi:MAG: DUF1287 domain-containing protein [Kiritimatiellae bacterium]|nr:DUF1287 domain-containing protein [Kiritimatiellia bacterium]